MLRESPDQVIQRTLSQDLDDVGRPIFDAAAYIAAMRAAGASLHPMRGRPGSYELDGSFAVAASDPSSVTSVQDAFAERRAADLSADGRVAKFLLDEAATARFAAVVRGDFAAALAELARLRAEEEEACQREVDCRRPCDGDEDDPAYREAMLAADLTGEAIHGGFRYVLAMPIASTADAGLKAVFALQHCDMGVERQQVLAEIAAFHVPELAGTLRDRPVLAA